MSDSFLSNITGFNSKYTQTDAAKYDDETDYSSVDFCQGFNDTEEVTESYDFDKDFIYEDEDKEGFNIEG